MTILIIAIVLGLVLAVLKEVGSSKAGGPRVVVKTYKGNKAAERGINQMLAKGYDIQGQSSRKVLYSLTTGIFTRKQKHTITFIKAAEQTATQEAIAAPPDVVGLPQD